MLLLPPTNPNNRRNMVTWLRRFNLTRRKLFAALICMLVLLILVPQGVLIHAGYEIRLFLDERGWSRCRLRKLPTLIQLNEAGYILVWESNCGISEMTFCLEKPEDTLGEVCTPVRPESLDETHHVFSRQFLCENPGEYKYRVGNDFSSSFHIHHPHANRGRLALISDNQSGTSMFVSLLNQIAQFSPDRVILGGDFVQDTELAEIQTQFFDPISVRSLGSSTPLALTFGNHDMNSRWVRSYLGAPPNRYYSFCHASSFILILDSRRGTADQELWLKERMESKEYQSAAFRIVFVHIAPFIELWDPKVWRAGESKWGGFVRRSWVPLFEKYQVDLVVSGHEHAYQRGEKNGVNYAIIGGGGGELDTERVEDWGIYRVTKSEHHFVILDLSPTQLSWKARGVGGHVIDEFVLTSRQPGG